LGNPIRETSALAHFLDPIVIEQTDSWSQLDALDEQGLIETLRHNKVAQEFEQRLEANPEVKERVLNAFPGVKVFLHDLNVRRKEELHAFSPIRNTFSENGVKFMLIKSDGSFPHESDNIDVLIKPKTLCVVSKLLKNAGYSELLEVREPHKFLFRNTHSYGLLPLHIHTRIEWEGTQFIDSRDLWNRRRVSEGENGFCVPSAEDCILITAAHFFFEDHDIKLADLLKIASRIRRYDLDWDYIIDHSRKLHWDDAFCLSMLLANHAYENLFERELLQQRVLSKISEANHAWVALFQKIIRPSGSGYTPLGIPYGLAAFFFIRRILLDSSRSLSQRLSQVDWVASDALRRRVLWPGYSSFS
jgi:hypothetical protein